MDGHRRGGIIDAEQLDTHLAQTEWFISQHRARIKPNDYSYSDEPMAPNGFGPKSPCNDGAILLADQEAATIGQLARYCINLGAIPPVPLKGFWWSRGRCLGMKAGDDLTDIVKVISYLRIHVGNVLNTEGVEPYLEAMEEVRSIGLGMFPNEDENWVTMEEAMDFTGRKEWAIYEWIRAGGLPVLDDRWGLMISKRHLQMKMAIVYANMLRSMANARSKNPLVKQNPSSS